MNCLKCNLAACAGVCACSVDGASIEEHAISDFCPHPDGPRFGSSTPPPQWEPKPIADAAIVTTPGRDWLSTAHALWDWLHDRPKIADLSTEEGRRAELGELSKFDQWVGRDLGGCSCSNHWHTLRAATPPILSSPLAYARWGWSMHNAVAKIVGNLPITFEAAIRIRGWESLIEPASMPARSTIEGR